MAVSTGIVSVLRGSRWFVSQIAVSVVATICVAALFPSTKAPDATTSSPAVVDSGKSAQRVANGAVEQTVLRFDAQQQAAMASLASFTPQAGTVPLVQVAGVTTGRTAVVKQAVAALPPRRPMLPAAVSPDAPVTVTAASQAPVASENWHVAGVGIPGSGTLRRYVPTGSDILATGSGAWTATASATKSMARKVVDLGGLLGLVVNVAAR